MIGIDALLVGKNPKPKIPDDTEVIDGPDAAVAFRQTFEVGKEALSSENEQAGGVPDLEPTDDAVLVLKGVEADLPDFTREEVETTLAAMEDAALIAPIGANTAQSSLAFAASVVFGRETPAKMTVQYSERVKFDQPPDIAADALISEGESLNRLVKQAVAPDSAAAQIPSDRLDQAVSSDPGLKKPAWENQPVTTVNENAPSLIGSEPSGETDQPNPAREVWATPASRITEFSAVPATSASSQATQLNTAFTAPQAMELIEKVASKPEVSDLDIQIPTDRGAQSQTPDLPKPQMSQVLAKTGITGAAVPIDMTQLASIEADEVLSAGQITTDRTPPASPHLSQQVVVPGQTIAPNQLPQTLAIHVERARMTGETGQIELRLDPEELGKLRITFTPREQGMLISVVAERNETLELLKRNSGDLLADLSSMDLGGTQLEFQSGDQSEMAPEGLSEGEEQEVKLGADVTILDNTATGLADDRLDLRL